jgi:hypothetical protein
MTDRYDNLAKRMECSPEEIPALIQQHAPWSGRDMCNDSIALVAEVERLRSINDDYLLETGILHALLRDQAREAKTERAAVVAWLLRNHYDDTAERIERGEHRRKEKE